MTSPTYPQQRPSEARSGARTEHSRPRRDESGLLGSRAEQVAMILLLVVMALADAYQFWYALQEIIQQDAELVALFVLGVMAGAVAAAHYVGRLTRSRREAYGGSITWIAVVSLLWLGIGVVVAWIRLTHGRRSDVGGAPGLSDDFAEVAGNAASETGSLQLAALLLALYLLTGAVAMTHAYRFGDPRSTEVRRTLRERRRYANEVARLAHLQRLAEGDWQARAAERKWDVEQNEREQGMHDSRRAESQTDSQQRIAAHEGDPQATDALLLGNQET